MSDIWLGAIATGVGALVVGTLLHLLNEGGVRRTRRRNIREELELLKLLDEDSSAAHRIRKRVDVMLEQYEPSDERVKQHRQRKLAAFQLLALCTLGVVLVNEFEITDPWVSGAMGGALALAASVGRLVYERRHDRAEQDEAVRGTLDGVTAQVTISVGGRVSGPESDPSPARADEEQTSEAGTQPAPDDVSVTRRTTARAPTGSSTTPDTRADQRPHP